MATPSAIRGMSLENLYKEFGLESLQKRRLYRNMIFFYKILNSLTPKYLLDIAPVWNDSYYNTRAQLKLELTQLYSRSKRFSNTVFPFNIKEWNKLDQKSNLIRFQIQQIA